MINTKEVEYFAGLLYTDEHLALILEMEVRELKVQLREGRTQVAKAVLRGRPLRECRVRAAELDMAENGSSPALAAARDMLKRMRQ